jgi:choline dehydrogenase-like flavoprotein
MICSTPPLADMIVERVFPSAPTIGKNGDGATDEDFSTWVSDTTVTDWHPVGTCAMGGSRGKADGVVDDQLRVYGVRGLRVIDASIMPLQISAYLQATVYAIGEKGASMIIEDWEEASRA